MNAYAGYRRVSRVGDRADTLISPEQQAVRIDAYAGARGLTVTMLPTELDVSGGKADRPVLEEILRGIEAGTYKGVIVARIDRLSRLGIADAYKLLDRIEGMGGELISVAESIDPSTPEGRFARGQFLLMAALELDRHKAGFASAKAQAVERGIWPMPKAPLGYTCIRVKDGGDGKLHPNPETRGRVEAAFRARAAGEPWAVVAGILGVGLSTAGKIIRNRAYLGEVNVKGAGRKSGAHEPLVGVALFEAAQLDHPAPPRGVHPPALLQGLVRCAGCQGAMTPNSYRHREYTERIYRCVAGNKAGGRCEAPAIIGQRKLDYYVEEIAITEIHSLRVNARERTNELAEAQDKLDAAVGELEAFQTLTLVTEVGRDAFSAGIRARMDAVESGRAALARAQATSAAIPDYGTVLDLWPTLTVSERAHVLRGAIGAIWVTKGRGPAWRRVRVVAAGFGPKRSNGRHVLEPLDWSADLEGEVGVPSAKNVA